MNEYENNPDFWCERITKTITKNDLPEGMWDWISKIRNSPIRLIESVPIGETNKPHMVLPAGMRGYLLDYPEEFALSEENRDRLSDHQKIFHGKYSELEGIPAIINGYADIVFLHDYEYEITSPFFDRALASYAESIIQKGESDAST